MPRILIGSATLTVPLLALSLTFLQDCELLYVAFDVLHDGENDVIAMPLRERLEKLEQVVLPGGPGGWVGGRVGGWAGGRACVWLIRGKACRGRWRVVVHWVQPRLLDPNNREFHAAL